MKLAFSTLGVPGMPIDDVARLAAAEGFHGVELRAHPDEAVHPGLAASERRRVAAVLRAADVEILSVAGDLPTAAPGRDEAVIDELDELLTLAHDLGATAVRVRPGGGDQPEKDADVVAARRLAAAAPRAVDLGVRLLLETHDSHPRGVDVARILGLIGHRAVGAVWDVMHPWLGGEDPAATYAVLAPHLGHIQVRDIASAEDTAPLPLGAGVLPLAECVELLSRASWDGWFSWEYDRLGHPGAADLPPLLGPARAHLSKLLSESA